MGCVVNGPGEAREADLGIAGGKGVGLVFKKGEVIRKVNEDELVDALMEEIEKAVEYAKDHGLKVEFSAEDATRTERDFLFYIYNSSVLSSHSV